MVNNISPNLILRWMYSNFINGLAEALKASGYGIRIAGRTVALLMYADDIVMLARTAEELMAMNKIATDFTRKHRFQEKRSHGLQHKCGRAKDCA
jgi:hypothetical protein